MANGHEVVCILCQRSEENRITGALSTKNLVTAHQNCLLYSSGLFCRESPQFDDLFGFSTEDVRAEVKRGSRLICSRCKKKGATVGCEVKRCQKSYHYPCAIQEGAKTRVDKRSGSYGLYCLRCYQKKKRNAPENSTEKRVHCLACENTEGNIKESLEGSTTVSYCKKHAPSSHEMRPSDEESNSSSTYIPHSSKRQLDFSDQQEGNVAKRWKSKTNDSTNSEMFAPLESDLEEGVNSPPDKLLNRKDSAIAGSGAGNPKVDENENGSIDASVGHSVSYEDEDSDSLLPTLQINKSTNHAVTPQEVPLDEVFSIDSTSFWKGCNTAGCTQAIFNDFINEMTDIYNRIKSEEASQRDYDLALKVMMTSGKLAELMVKQQKDLQKKQMEMQQAAVALNKVVLLLKR